MWPNITLPSNALESVRLITGRSHPDLANAVAKQLGMPLMECPVTTFSNTESRIKPSAGEENTFRGKHMFVIQTGSFGAGCSINDHVMETRLLMDACRRGGCKSITLVMPFYPYARQDKKDSSRAPISAAVIADIFRDANRVICYDLHNPCIQGLFRVSCDNLFTTKILRKWFTDNLFKDADYDKKFVLISPDEGAMKKTRIIANILGLPFLTMSKTRDYKTENHVEQIVLLFPHDQNNGDQSVLRGKTAIIVDDMIDTAGTVIQAVDKLMEFGAVGCGVTATHGVLSGPALERINKCDALKFVLVSDTLPQTENQRKSSKIQVYSIADMLAEVIRRVTVDHSLSSLF